VRHAEQIGNRKHGTVPRVRRNAVAGTRSWGDVLRRSSFTVRKIARRNAAMSGAPLPHYLTVIPDLFRDPPVRALIGH